MEEIRAVFDWQPGEHAEVVGILSREANSKQWRLIRWGGGSVVAGLVALILFRLLVGDTEFAMAILPWTLFIAFWLWIFRTMSSRRVAGRLLAPADYRVDYPFVHIFSETGLRVEVMGGATELHWSGMFKAREEDGYFLCYWNDACAHYTPKRALSINAQNRLRLLIQERLSDRADVREQLSDRAGQSRDVV